METPGPELLPFRPPKRMPGVSGTDSKDIGKKEMNAVSAYILLFSPGSFPLLPHSFWSKNGTNPHFRLFSRGCTGYYREPFPVCQWQFNMFVTFFNTQKKPPGLYVLILYFCLYVFVFFMYIAHLYFTFLLHYC